MKETGGSSCSELSVTLRGGEIDVLAMQAAHPNALAAQNIFYLYSLHNNKYPICLYIYIK